MSRFLICMTCLVCVVAMACTHSHDNAKVGFTLPAKRMSSMHGASAATETSRWGLATPTSIAEADCYAVFVNAPDLGGSKCTSLSQNLVQNLGNFYGQYPAGSSVEIEVASGTARQIGLIAFNTSGSCSGALTPTFDRTKNSAPLIVGTSTSDLVAGANSVNIVASMTGAKQIESCEGPAFAALPNSQWPNQNCTVPTVTSARYASATGLLSLNGSCLDLATSLKLHNSTTAEDLTLQVVSQAAGSITAKFVTAAVINSANLLSLIISRANAEAVVVPVGLDLADGSLAPSKLTPGSANNDVLAYDSGSGKAMWKSLSNLGVGGPGTNDIFLKDPSANILGKVLVASYNKIVTETSSGDLLAYFSNNGYTNMHLMNGVVTVDPALAGLSFSDLARLNLMPSSNIYFAGANCTGNILIPASSSNSIVKGKFIHIPSGCSYVSMVGNTCSSHTYQKLTATIGATKYVSNYTVGSLINTGMMGGDDWEYCSNTSGTVSGFEVVTGTDTTTLGSSPPATLSTLSLSH